MNKKIISLIITTLVFLPVLLVTADENNNLIVNHPPDPPVIISGQEIGVAKEKYQYTISAFDRDGDDVYYHIDWNGKTKDIYALDVSEDEVWFGPYKSGKEITFDHTWTKKGEYTIVVTAKDNHGFLSKDTNYQVSISKNKIVNIPIFYQIVERFPIIIQILNWLGNI